MQLRRTLRGPLPLPPVVDWAPDGADGRRRIVYTGWLAGAPDLVLHHGVDGWQGPLRDLPFEQVEASEGPPAAIVEVPDLEGHLAIDFVVRSQDRWDNNSDANYRLWTTLDPVDSHVHARDDGDGGLGAAALRASLASAGIRRAVVSWQSNHYIGRLLRRSPALTGLVWVRPGTALAEVRLMLASGRAGLKLHPNVDGYDADDTRMDRYLRVAVRHGVPVAIHSAPGHGDPDRIRRLAERHPEVTVVLYHTYLGPYEGRRRAVAHALQVPNLVLETSWCKADEVRWIIDQVGADRVIFGSDAAVDGPRHFVDPIVENAESYNDGLLALARALDPADAQAVLTDNTCRIFGLAPPPLVQPRRDQASTVSGSAMMTGMTDDPAAAPATVVSADALQPADPSPGMTRRLAFETARTWSGTVVTEADTASGWHHHGDHDTTLYVVEGRVRMESGPGGSVVGEAGPGDFLHIPPHAVHREVNPSGEPSTMVIVRSGTGPPTINVEGPAQG